MRRFALVLALVTPACANRAKQSVSLYDSGDYAGAARAAEEGLAGHPDDDSLWGMKIRAALALGDADGIAKAYAGYTAHRGDLDKELLQDLSEATIAQALASPSAKLKMEAIEAIEHLEIHSLADDVAKEMENQDDRVAATAAVAVLFGFPDAPQVVDQMMKSENAEARRIAVEGIGKKVSKRGEQIRVLAAVDLAKAAADHDPRVRRAAVYWLGALKDKDALEVLTKRMHDPDESVRAAAAQALAKIGIGNLEAFAKQALGDHALAVRLAGVELLSAAKRDDELVTLTDDKDPMVALTAAIAVKSTRPELAKKALDRAVGAEEWTIRAGTANMLAMAVGSDDAKTYAQKLAGDTAVGVRLAAARVLAHAGDRDTAKRVFSAALTDPDMGVEAAADLASLGDAAGLQALSDATRDQKRTAEQRAAAAAAHRTARRVTPGLVAALADPNGLVRIEAAATLGALAAPWPKS